MADGMEKMDADIRLKGGKQWRKTVYWDRTISLYNLLPVFKKYP